MLKRDAPATRRNREPILEVLRRLFTGPARVLEIASGSGQHAVFFAESMPALDWQTSDVDADSLASIRAWLEDAGMPEPAAADRDRRGGAGLGRRARSPSTRSSTRT